MTRRLLGLIPYLLVAAIAFAMLRVWVPVSVVGSSMHPALHRGDVVLVSRRVPRVGEIALLRPARHGLVIHRIVGHREDGTFRTKGDANPTADIEPVSAAEVGGTVVRVLPFGALLSGL